MQKKIKFLNDYLLILIGTTIMATAINVFIQPHHLVTGGFTGLAILIQELSAQMIGYSVPLWLTNAVLNVPLFLIGLRVFGLKQLSKTLFATGFLTFALYFTGYIPVFHTDYTLATVFGGVVAGIGLGLVFRCMATTGGTDMAASLIHTKVKHMSISRIMFMIDSVIIALGFFVFGPMNALYAIIVVFIEVKVIDSMLEGLSFAKAAFIISEHSDEIADKVMVELDRGITGLSGKGMYTQKNKNVLFCVVSTKEIVKMKELVAAIDKEAFFIVADVREVLGEGFKSMP